MSAAVTEGLEKLEDMIVPGRGMGPGVAAKAAIKRDL
jgi:hypothetical protein